MTAQYEDGVSNTGWEIHSTENHTYSTKNEVLREGFLSLGITDRRGCPMHYRMFCSIPDL